MPLYSSPVLTHDGRRLPSVGKEVCTWIEANVRLGGGDYLGEPFQLTSYQRRWIHRLFEVYPETGLFRYKRGLFGTAKGNGKTPFEGALAAEGLGGPTAPPAPLVLMSAASLEQSNLGFGDVKLGLCGPTSPLREFFVPLELSIQLRDGPGEIKRVAAVAGTNDGPRATRLLADELHEWTGRLAHVFDVLDGAIGKRRNAWTAAISTAGTDKNSKLGKMYRRGLALANGESVDDAFLFEWYEAPDDVAEAVPEVIESPEDERRWREAVLWANPALTEADFLTWDYIRSRFDGAQAIERWKWFRYHLNRWTQAISQWLPAGKWRSNARPRESQRGEEAILAFSGTYDRDSAGLIAVLRDGLIIRLGSWEPPQEDTPEGFYYEVPEEEVEVAVRDAFAFYRVQTFVVNPNGWHGEATAWSRAYGEEVVVEFDWAHQNRRKHDSCSRFFTGVVTGDVLNDGDPTIERHLNSATERETADGAWITKSSRNGPPIDLAVAAVMGWDSYEAPAPASKPGRLVSL